MGDTVTLAALIAGLVLAIPAVVCASLAIDRARDTLLPHRERLVMLGGPVMVAAGLTAPIFVWCILQASVNQPEPGDKNYAAPLVVTVDVAPAAALVPPAPPAPTPTPGAELAPLPAPGSEPPKAGDAGAAPAPAPAPGAEAPKAGDAGAAPAPAPAPGAETPKAGDAGAAPAPLPVPGAEAPKAGGDTPKAPDAAAAPTAT